MKKRNMSLGQDEAVGWKRRERLGGGEELDITPMIDITFLLLIFFMVTSTMQSEQALDIPTARNGANVDAGQAVMLEIHPATSIGAEPVVKIDGETVALTEISDIIRREMQQQSLNVVIKAGREVPHGFVRQVIQSANISKELDFSFGVEDKPGS